MSIRLIKSLRHFGELHQIFAIPPIYPDERVKRVDISPGTPSAKSQRDRRLFMLLKREKLSMAMKQYIHGINENNQLLKTIHEPINKSRTPEEQKADSAELLKSYIDSDTKLPIGLGYDHMIKTIREEKVSETSQDQLRDIWINLGFYSTESVIAASPGIELGDSAEKINRRIFTNRHKITPSPYKGVFNERNPKSVNIEKSDPEFFSMSSDDIKKKDSNFIGIRKAKEKYHEQLIYESDSEVTEDDLSFDHNSKKKNKDSYFSKINFDNPMFSRNLLKSLNLKDSNKVKQNIKVAGKMTGKMITKKMKPLFKMMDKDDFVKKKDLEYEIKKNYGPVPSFAEVIAEAEEIILNNPKLYERYKIDEYKKNLQFEPRYLGNSVSIEDYHWSFMPKKEEAIFPGYITGKYPFRQSSRKLVLNDSIVSRHKSEEFVPNTSDLSRKSLSLIKKDPNHEHYLKNHLVMWIDDYRKHINFEGYGKEHKTVPVVPWEYLKLKKPTQLKMRKETKVEADAEGYVSSTGKRKRALAKAYVKYGTGDVTINGKNLIQYCSDVVSRDRIIRPLTVSKLVGLIDIKAEVHGGGFMGQSFALRQAIAKALIRMIPDASPIICSSGMIERDPRQVERKKTSKFKARKSYTFVKR